MFVEQGKRIGTLGGDVNPPRFRERYRPQDQQGEAVEAAGMGKLNGGEE